MNRQMQSQNPKDVNLRFPDEVQDVRILFFVVGKIMLPAMKIIPPRWGFDEEGVIRSTKISPLQGLG